MKKKLYVVLAGITVCASLAACGGSSDTTTSAPAPDAPAASEAVTEAAPAAASVTIASTETWGDFTVGVPEGWKFRKGDSLDETDTHYCSVKKSDFSYFDFKMEKEEIYKQKYDQNKATYTNEQVDVSGKFGDIDWTGFQYSDGWGGYGFELYATANGKPVRVSCAGFKFDSPETKAVLESLKIK